MKNKNLPLNRNMFLFSMIIIAYEILLARVFSVKYNYHFSFLAISLAIAGIGIGSFLYSILKYDEEATNKIVWQAFALYNLLFTVIIISRTVLNNIFFLPLLPLIAFTCYGFYLAFAFSQNQSRAGQLYFSNLAGGAVGAFFIIYLIKIGAVQSILFFVILVIILFAKKKKWALAIIGVLAFLLAFSIYKPRAFVISISQNAKKEIVNFLDSRDKLLDVRWSILGRAEVVKESDAQYAIFSDGTAGSNMYKFSGAFSNIDANSLPRVQSLFNFPGIVPFIFMPEQKKKQALVIGPGGGRDILLLKAAGIKNIDAVEVNDNVIKIVKDYAAFNGDIINAPDVKYYNEDGRAFIHRVSKKYDIIYMSLPITNVSRSPEAFNLTESFLFTKESMKEYYSKLNEGGQLIVVTHGLHELYKLVFLTLETLTALGEKNTAIFSQFYTFGTPMFPVFVLKKGELTEKETEEVHSFVMQRGLFVADSFYIPGVTQMVHPSPSGAGNTAMLNQILYMMSKRTVLDFEQTYATANYNIAPPSDDNPYFYRFAKGIPFEIVYILVLGAVITAFFFFWPSLKRKQVVEGGRMAYKTYFVLIGISFMLIEVTLISKFSLLLGRPALSFAVTLVSILLGAACGSFVLDKAGEKKNVFIAAVIGLAAISILYGLFLDNLIYTLLKQGLFTKAVAAFFISFLISFPMGMPFPFAINVLKTRSVKSVPQMLAINGSASIVGSTSAIVVSIYSGLHFNMYVAAALYIAALLLMAGNKNNEDEG